MKTYFYFKVLLLLASLIQLQQADAQTTTTRSLTIDLGPSYLQRQDHIFSPFINTAFSSINGGLKFEKQKKLVTKYMIRYSGYSAGLETPYSYIYEGDVKTAYPHNFAFLSATYMAGRSLGSKASHRPVLGGAIQLDVQAMTYEYGRYSFFGYYSTTAAGAWYQYSVPVGKKVVCHPRTNDATPG